MAKTYNDLYLDLRQRLRKAGVEAAQLEARELICHAAGKSQEEFLKDSRLYAPSPVEEQLELDVQRRLAGEPVAYIIGEWNFYGLPLTVTPAVLIPRPDTEIIAARAIELAKGAGAQGRVLDLCTGSGCIAWLWPSTRRTVGWCWATCLRTPSGSAGRTPAKMA